MSSPFDFSSFLLTPPIPGSLPDQNGSNTSQQAVSLQNGQPSNVSGNMPSRDISVPNNGGGLFSNGSNIHDKSNPAMQQQQQQLPLRSPQQQFFNLNATPTNAGSRLGLGEGILANFNSDGSPNHFTNSQSGPNGKASADPTQLRTSQQQQSAASPAFVSPKSAAHTQQSNVNRIQQQQQVMHRHQQKHQSHNDTKSLNGAPSNLNTFTNNSSNVNAVASGSKLSSFDERDYGLDPSAFSSVSFQMPSFLTAASNTAQFGNEGRAIVDPQAFHVPTGPSNVYQPSVFSQDGPHSNTTSFAVTAHQGLQHAQQQQSLQMQIAQQQQHQQMIHPPPGVQNNFGFDYSISVEPPSYGQSQQSMRSNPGVAASSQFSAALPVSTRPPIDPFSQSRSEGKKAVSNVIDPGTAGNYKPDLNNPVYGIYGSSVISVNPDSTPFKLQLNAAQPPFDYAQAESRGTTPDFDPKTLGLPIGNRLFPQPLPGLYSTSGFDMLGVLARVVARPNAQINIGPVDTSCAFLVVDARRYDMPIVFASQTFTDLTGYTNSEIIGRNCRFLQAPDGHVAMGSRRRYTDGNAVYHLKTHIQSGKESQASIINYRKDGTPFINLVTVIPITWDTDEIAYFVGFQVDLVEQPNAILEKMRNGTYVVNYSLLPTQPAITHNVEVTVPTEPPEDTLPTDATAWSEQKAVKTAHAVPPIPVVPAVVAQPNVTIAPALLEVMNMGDNGDDVDDDTARKKWNKMLLDNTGDFVHVLSLKGSFLYVSPSVTAMLEYEPSELVGKTIQSVCHPSDIVPVMRELKESSTIAHPVINLLFRIRRKLSGYVWLEAQGKLYLEQSKSRKCVILVGRERPVYKISWTDLRDGGGLGEKEFWSKISSDGMVLYATPTVKAVLNVTAEQLRGKSLFELVEPDKGAELSKALADATAGQSVRLHHKLKNQAGVLIDVVTNFFPNSQFRAPSYKTVTGVICPSVIAQTNEYGSELRRRATVRLAATPVSVTRTSASVPDRPAFIHVQSNPQVVRDMIVTGGASSDDSDSAKGEGSARSAVTHSSGSDGSAPSTFSAIPSTYKSLLLQSGPGLDNIFDELDTTRTTSWQYELQQLKLTNKKLKEELQMLQAARRKRKKKDAQDQTAVPSGVSSSTSGNASGDGSGSASPGPTTSHKKFCANCGTRDSPEWRLGPNGQRNLCNACGLRWGKATRQHNRPMSATPVSTPSSGSENISDGNAPSSYMQAAQPLGPFAANRPSLARAESARFYQ